MKKHLWKIYAAITAVFFVIGLGVVGYVLSPYNPRNVSDEAVIRNGTEYKVKLSGISEYDENGFLLVFDGLYLSGTDINVMVGKDGFIYSDYENESDIQLDERYCSAYIDYEDYDFCGEIYTDRQALEELFKKPDMIYNFDVNKLGIYIQDVITYEKKFYGEATVKIYRERLVITEVCIGEEKALVRKGIV